jgi:hypothetical protein
MLLVQEIHARLQKGVLLGQLLIYQHHLSLDLSCLYHQMWHQQILYRQEVAQWDISQTLLDPLWELSLR